MVRVNIEENMFEGIWNLKSKISAKIFNFPSKSLSERVSPTLFAYYCKILVV